MITYYLIKFAFCLLVIAIILELYTSWKIDNKGEQNE